MGPNTILENYIKSTKDVLKVKLIIFQHTIIMKLGRLLIMIVHYRFEFILECCNSCGPHISPNTIFTIIKKIIKRRHESEIK